MDEIQFSHKGAQKAAKTREFMTLSVSIFVLFRG